MTRLVVMELGIYAFGDLGADPHTGQSQSIGERLEGIIQLGISAETMGLDVVAVGEHHGRNFTVSAPEIILGALARETNKVRLTTAATILSTNDPVRVFQQMATLDQISKGRAEIVAGKGASTESFEIFGYETEDHDDLFEEKLRLLLRLRETNPITWQGEMRAPLNETFLTPCPKQKQLPVWIASGGSKSSLELAAQTASPIFLSAFQPTQNLAARLPIYFDAADAAGIQSSSLSVASGSHLYVGKTSQASRSDFFPYYAGYWQNNSARFTSAFPKETFEEWTSPDGPMLIGSPQQVIDKLMKHHELLGISRFIGQIDVGSMPSGMAQDSLELFATEVAPVLRKETASSS